MGNDFDIDFSSLSTVSTVLPPFTTGETFLFISISCVSLQHGKKPSLFPASKLPRLNFFNIFLHFNFELLSPAATRFLQTSFNNFTANGFAKVHDDSLRFAIEKTRGANSRMKAIYSLAKRGSLAVEPYQLAEFRMSV